MDSASSSPEGQEKIGNRSCDYHFVKEKEFWKPMQKINLCIEEDTPEPIKAKTIGLWFGPLSALCLPVYLPTA